MVSLLWWQAYSESWIVQGLQHVIPVKLRGFWNCLRWSCKLMEWWIRSEQYSKDIGLGVLHRYEHQLCADTKTNWFSRAQPVCLKTPEPSTRKILTQTIPQWPTNSRKTPLRRGMPSNPPQRITKKSQASGKEPGKAHLAPTLPYSGLVRIFTVVFAVLAVTLCICALFHTAVTLSARYLFQS